MQDTPLSWLAHVYHHPYPLLLHPSFLSFSRPRPRPSTPPPFLFQTMRNEPYLLYRVYEWIVNSSLKTYPPFPNSISTQIFFNLQQHSLFTTAPAQTLWLDKGPGHWVTDSLIFWFNCTIPLCTSKWTEGWFGYWLIWKQEKHVGFCLLTF